MKQTMRVTLASPHLETMSLVIRIVGYSQVCRVKLQPQRRFDPICLPLMHVSAFASWHGGDESPSSPGTIFISYFSIVVNEADSFHSHLWHFKTLHIKWSKESNFRNNQLL